MGRLYFGGCQRLQEDEKMKKMEMARKSGAMSPQFRATRLNNWARDGFKKRTPTT